MGRKWEKLITFDRASLNSGFDGADIADHEFQKARDVIFDNKALESAPGRSVVGTETSTGYPIDGICKSWDKLGNKTLIRVTNGAIERWTGSAWTNVLSGLTADVPYDFLNVDDKTAIINGYNEARVFDPSTNTIKKLGLEPPRYYKKIAYFESDEESLWSLGAGAAFNESNFRVEERTGTSKQSLYLISPTATTRTSVLTYASKQDFSQFANGISIPNDAFFCISILHRSRAYVDYITFTFTTSAGNYYTLTIDGTELDPVDQRDNVWTTILVKKSRFVATESPDWSSIVSFSVSLRGQTGNAEIFIDNCYWKNPPIEVAPYRKQIDNFEGSLSDWTITNGTLANGLAPDDIREGTKSLVATRTDTPTTFYKTVSLDLTNYLDAASQVSDDICISVKIGSTANLTSITLKHYTDDSNYFYYTFTVAGLELKPGWNDLRKAKSSFTSSGSPSWASIAKIEISFISTGDISLVFDNWALEPAQNVKVLATMDMEKEAWVFSADAYGYSSGNPPVGYPYWPTIQGVPVVPVPLKTEGTTSIWIQANADIGNLSSATLTLSSSVDLTALGAGVSSDDTDMISFWMYLTWYNDIKYVRVEIDCNLGDFSTDYFWYEFSDFTFLQQYHYQRWGRVEIEKQNFVRVGATDGKGWDTVKAYRFKFRAVSWGSGSIWHPFAFFDDLMMVRQSAILKGIYQWTCVFVGSDGTRSAISEWSEQVTLTGSKAVLTLLPLSADSDVAERRFYRKGGSLGSTARHDFSIFDNTTVTYISDILDENLGEILDGSTVPMGTIRIPLGSKWGPRFKGEYILYRDPSNLRRVYHSLVDKIYGWSELQAYDFESDVLDVFIIDNILFFNTKNGIKSLSKAMSEATPDDFRELGFAKYSVGPFASYQLDEERALVSYDGAYIFNGIFARYISDDVKDYFDPSTYTIQNAIMFYRKRHLYISVMTTGGLRRLLDCYLKTDGTVAWRSSDYVVNCFAVAQGIGDNNEIYIGDRSGNVYQFDLGYVSDWQLTTKDFPVSDHGDPFEEVVLNEIYVMARSKSVNPGAVRVQFRINQKASLITKSFPSVGHLSSLYKLYHTQLRGVEDYLKGYKIGLIITPFESGKHQAIEAIKLVGEVASLEETYETGLLALQLTDGLYLELTDGDYLYLTGESTGVSTDSILFAESGEMLLREEE